MTAFCLIIALKYLESYRIEFMPVILFGYFNQLNYGLRRPLAHSPEVYIGLIGFKTETLRGLFRTEVPLYAVISRFGNFDVTLPERDHYVNIEILEVTF